MSSTTKEITYSIEAVYTPFDDTNSKQQVALAKARQNTKDGMDTSAFDIWRQGVELTDSKFVYGSSQPKIWAGNTLGITDIVVYGQAPSWVDYEGTIAFDDTVYERTPLQTAQFASVSEVFTQTEDGPMYRLEAIMEPLTIPGRVNINDLNPERSFRASIESGNPDDDYQLGSSTDVVSSFVEYKDNKQTRYFIDGGVKYYGAGAQDQRIVTPGTRSNKVESNKYGFDDLTDLTLINSLNIGTGGNSTTFKQTITLLQINLDEDLRNNYEVRSAACGGDVYGANQAIYGTDSIAYMGTYRG